MLKAKPTLAIRGVDTAENGPSETYDVVTRYVSVMCSAVTITVYVETSGLFLSTRLGEPPSLEPVLVLCEIVLKASEELLGIFARFHRNIW